MEKFCLENYLNNGVERMVKEIIRISIPAPKKTSSILKFIISEKHARTLRMEAEKRGEHIPSFLIASITTECNLKCKGCYANENQSCRNAGTEKELTKIQWAHIFSQAEELGIPFILLAGGEPLIRLEIIREAALHKHIIFPVFTNGTLLTEEVISLFSENNNLIPVLSLEGDHEKTDERRGDGVYGLLMHSMEELQRKHVLFGVSVTVMKKNLTQVTSGEFVEGLRIRGCRAVIYVEYVPADRTSTDLALGDGERIVLADRLMIIRKKVENMLFLSFPGDEKASAGCLAAGRGFFHINAYGGAEPCPFSPYSDTSLIHTGLKEALNSPLFLKIRSDALLSENHDGGCSLFEQEEQVKKYLKGTERE